MTLVPSQNLKGPVQMRSLDLHQLSIQSTSDPLGLQTQVTIRLICRPCQHRLQVLTSEPDDSIVEREAKWDGLRWRWRWEGGENRGYLLSPHYLILNKGRNHYLQGLSWQPMNCWSSFNVFWCCKRGWLGQLLQIATTALLLQTHNLHSLSTRLLILFK